jgi:hypothetical protein
VRVKVVIEDGIITDVLSDGEAEVEIIDVNVDYEDYDALCKRRQEVLEDDTLHEIDFTVTKFEEG